MRPAPSSTMIGQPHAAAFRSPLPASYSKHEKREDGRISAALPPADVRVIGVELDDEDQTYIRRKLGAKLAKFAKSIERVSVRVTDVNGPRGGVDQVCCVRVALAGLPSVVVIRREAAVRAAIDAALHAIEHAVRGIVGRRRMKPRRSRI